MTDGYTENHRRTRNWSIAAAKASNAIVEAIAADKIAAWYAIQGKKASISWNQATDIGRKREFDLIDTYGTRWAIKTDKIANDTNRVFIEECLQTTSQAEMVAYFISPFAYIIPRAELLVLPRIGEAQGGDFGLAHGYFVALRSLIEAADAV
jgi:hypothetical protein